MHWHTSFGLSFKLYTPQYGGAFNSGDRIKEQDF